MFGFAEELVLYQVSYKGGVIMSLFVFPIFLKRNILKSVTVARNLSTGFKNAGLVNSCRDNSCGVCVSPVYLTVYIFSDDTKKKNGENTDTDHNVDSKRFPAARHSIMYLSLYTVYS